MLENYDYESVIGFDWNERKSELNLAKHGIDFGDAIEIFYGPIILRRSDRNEEERWLAIGRSHDRIVSVIFTFRRESIRIISARHPRSNEERAYRNASIGGSAQRQD